jgi:hypothetical protein
LIICATMMLVLSTHYFDATSRTRELLDRLEIYAKEFESNHPCRYTAAELEAELESRTQLDYRMLDISYVGPTSLPSGPTVDAFLDSKALYQPRCARPELAAALDPIEGMLRRNASANDGRSVMGELRVRHAVDHYEVEIIGLHRRPRRGSFEPTDAAASAWSEHASASLEPLTFTIPVKLHTSYAEWLEQRHDFGQTDLEEMSSLVHRPSVRGVVEGLTFGEASKVLEALSDPEHDRITLFGFSAPATVIGIMGAPVLLAYCLLLLTYLVQIKNYMSSDPLAIRRFPWFVTLTGRLPAAMTNLTLLVPVATAATIFIRLGIGTGHFTRESIATAVISAVCTAAMLPVLFSMHETISRIRPGKDMVVEAAMHSELGEAVSLARIGAALREQRMAERVSLESIEQTFEISIKQLDEFERGRGDLPVSYLMMVAAAIESELMLVPTRRRPDGSQIVVEISMTEAMNRIAAENEDDG